MFDIRDLDFNVLSYIPEIKTYGILGNRRDINSVSLVCKRWQEWLITLPSYYLGDTFTNEITTHGHSKPSLTKLNKAIASKVAPLFTAMVKDPSLEPPTAPLLPHFLFHSCSYDGRSLLHTILIEKIKQRSVPISFNNHLLLNKPFAFKIDQKISPLAFIFLRTKNPSIDTSNFTRSMAERLYASGASLPLQIPKTLLYDTLFDIGGLKSFLDSKEITALWKARDEVIYISEIRNENLDAAKLNLLHEAIHNDEKTAIPLYALTSNISWLLDAFELTRMQKISFVGLSDLFSLALNQKDNKLAITLLQMGITSHSDIDEVLYPIFIKGGDLLSLFIKMKVIDFNALFCIHLINQKPIHEFFDRLVSLEPSVPPDEILLGFFTEYLKLFFEELYVIENSPIEYVKRACNGITKKVWKILTTRFPHLENFITTANCNGEDTPIHRLQAAYPYIADLLRSNQWVQSSVIWSCNNIRGETIWEQTSQLSIHHEFITLLPTNDYAHLLKMLEEGLTPPKDIGFKKAPFLCVLVDYLSTALATEFVTIDLAEAVLEKVLEQQNPNSCNKDGNTSLHLLAVKSNGYADLILLRALLEAGANPTQRNREGMTPLKQAENNSNLHILKMMLDY